MLKPTVLEGSKAGHLGNRNFIVAMGTSIPCALETALSSDQPGFTSCVITRDVLSDNGRVVLMEKARKLLASIEGPTPWPEPAVRLVESGQDPNRCHHHSRLAGDRRDRPRRL